MLLSNAMRTPRAVERGTVSWDEMMAGARAVSLGSGEYGVGRSSAERLSPIAAAHRILCNDFGMIPFALYRREGEARVPESDEAIDAVFKVRPTATMTPYMCHRTLMSNAFWHGGRVTARYKQGELLFRRYDPARNP